MSQIAFTMNLMAGARTLQTDPIGAYANGLDAESKAICAKLRAAIDANLPNASSKVWHGAPVWFSGENPIVGYSRVKTGVSLLFWNGQAMNDERLVSAGKHGAAQTIFTSQGAIDDETLSHWLTWARDNVFDSRAYFAAKRESN